MPDIRAAVTATELIEVADDLLERLQETTAHLMRVAEELHDERMGKDARHVWRRLEAVGLYLESMSVRATDLCNSLLTTE